MIFAKILSILYLAIFSASFLTHDTSASFSDTKKVDSTIQAGVWWDKSKLKFTGNNTQNIKACPKTDITVGIKNIGMAMVGSTEYEVYYSENGNPKQAGHKVTVGIINPIAAGGTVALTYHADKVGSYMFKAIQRPGYDNNYKKRQELWSEKVMVKCIEKDENQENSVNENEDKKINDQNTEDNKTEETKTEETNGQKIEETKTEVSNDQKIEETNTEEPNGQKIKETKTEETNDQKIEETKTEEPNSQNIEKIHIDESKKEEIDNL